MCKYRWDLVFRGLWLGVDGPVAVSLGKWYSELLREG